MINLLLIIYALFLGVNSSDLDAVFNPYFPFDLVPTLGRGPCVLPYKDFPDKEPVFLNAEYQLIKPSDNAIILMPRQTIYLACPGSGNNLVVSSQSLTEATCLRGKILDVAGQDQHLSTLSCRRSVTGDLKQMDLMGDCADNKGKYIGVGHQITPDIFLSLFMNCYDFNRGATIYSEHTIYGSAIFNGKTDATRPSFKKGNVDIGINPDAYKQTKQLAVFTAYMGRPIAEQYINSGSYLARGHLAPDADFVYMSSRWATYFYVNVLPQWHQDVNNRNWKTLEGAIRKAAGRANQEFKIVTGGSEDVLTLQGQQIYLDNGKLPVPKFTWKIVKNKNTREAIAFVTSNNPFDPSVNKICPDITEDYGWLVEDYKNYRKGLTYACDVNALRSVVPSAPSIQYNKIMKGPNPTANWVDRIIGNSARRHDELRMG